MPTQDRRYASGEWEVDLGRRELRARGVTVPIGARAFEIIEVLVQSAGELVTKDDLMNRVWHGTIVEENTLQVHISAVRKALGPDRGMLKTVSGRGYRMIGDWKIREHREEGRATEAGELEPVPISTPVRLFQNNLPVAASDLIGRSAALQHLRDLLSAYRAVTLTGPGGIGKTVLALEAARSLFPSFHGDAWFVELVPLSDPALVSSVVAGVLELKLGAGEISPEAVARAIGRKKLLLILDNCEHVIDAAARLAETVVRMCPHTSVLATSREILRIESEYVYRVPPLDVPPPQPKEAADVLEKSAVQLFTARTKALHSDFVLGGANLAAIAAICRRLDGIPLAIELAAARAATLGPQQVAARLDDRFGLLTGGRRTALLRHQTLRATLDWSYELLPEAEKSLLRHLAIFAAGFTLEAAAAVMDGTGIAAPAVVDGIANLVAKSLIALDGGTAAPSRWRLLETVRAYALEKLAEHSEAEAAARRHAFYFRDLVAATSAAPSAPAIDDLVRYGREIDNVRAALDWAFSPRGDPAVGLALTAAYVPVWIHLALLVECRERTERALNSVAPEQHDLSPRFRMQLLTALGLALVVTMGSMEKTQTAFTEALEIAEKLNDVAAQLETLWVLWSSHLNSGDCRATQSTAERFSHVAARVDDAAVALVADQLMGIPLHHSGNQREAERYLQRMLRPDLVPRIEQRTLMFQVDQRVMGRAILARVHLLQGFVDQASREAQTLLEEQQAAGNRLELWWALRFAVCPITIMTGDLDAAARAVAMLNDLATVHNASFWKVVGEFFEGKLLIKRNAFAAGSALLRSIIETCERTGWSIWYPEFVGVLAEGLAGLGEIPEALATVDKALSAADGSGERWYLSELLRVKGELLLRQAEGGAIAAAENCFAAALDVAQQQGALFFELRAGMSLARLRQEQRRADEARALLQPVYDRFTEGFETPDLRAAWAMLQSLPPPRGDI